MKKLVCDGIDRVAVRLELALVLLRVSMIFFLTSAWPAVSLSDATRPTWRAR